MADKYTRYRQRNNSKPFYKFRIHRQNARARGIPFRLTFEQWWRIWQRSGKWKQRGSRPGQYCMARPGDRGAYEIGNVTICSVDENRAERNRNHPLRGDANPAFGKDYWAMASKMERKRRKSAIGAVMDRLWTPQRRKQMSKTMLGRQRVYARDGSWTLVRP
jgi:hypothetical protein